MLLALLLQAQAVPAVTQAPTQPQPPATFVVEPAAMAIVGWDADGDGRTTRAEMEAGVRRSFVGVDAAKAGSIGYIAFADWATRWLGDPNALPSPFEVDANGDDRITLAELEAAFGRIFDRLDKDRDGAVTRKEALTIRANAGMANGPPAGRHKRR
ncbi:MULTISPECIES: EF-hand domain-containing protein [unclassified Sphingomonas]|jgi:EF hand|uniref:EF-hand domain-containing protein n=1 Tax=unclassified Sphingomonas TaxID=196159 RepID=UPI001E448755|nr:MULTISPECIES: EF-hand domain-containing protein [unclassified Sphingomonas]